MSDEVHSPWDALDTIGNIAAWVRDNCGDATNQTQKYMDDIIMFVNAALALPRRNCERFRNADEALEALERHCDSSGNGCIRCPVAGSSTEEVECKIAWLFALAEGREAQQETKGKEQK